jgi:glyoxylase-like metal-dependent hydrolase (beta-lactamase superfamily II)
MSSIRIHAIETGKVEIKESQVEGSGHGWRRRLAPLTDKNWTKPLPILAWAIEHPEGLFVVDTGDTARTSEPGYFPRWHPYHRRAARLLVEPDEEIGPRMRALGLDPKDAKKLVLTHMHTDHAGGLHHFEGVPTLVDQKELDVAAGFKGKVNGYLPHRFPTTFAPEPIAWTDHAVGPFDRSFPLTEAGDVVIVPTPGHTPGHVSVLVEDRILIAGDIGYYDALIRKGALDGVAADENAATDSMAKARATGAVLLPTHDPGSAARLADAQR